jgi:hypothetical protein
MKKIIIVAIIGVALSVSYYFVSFLPSQKLVKTQMETQAFLFEKQTECKEVCEKLYEEDKKTFSENSVFNPRYSYNQNKNACFYSGGWLSVSPKNLTRRVMNCQTNKEVLTYTEVDDKVFTSFCDTCVSSISEYNKKEKEFVTD